MNVIRITSGKYKGRKIATPGGGTHPMGERERIALFNMIVGDLAEARVLDVFSGSGALGIEALSRGAAEVVFVEKDARACGVIRKNLANLGLVAKVVQEKVSDFVSDEKFNVILADPPYDKFDLAEVTHLLQFLQSGGVLVLSHPDEAPELTGVKLVKSHKYAGATISVYLKG